MIVVRYAVCSEREQKPLTRAVVDNRAEAERLVERYRREDGHDSETAYWIAELGPECEAWRWLARKGGKASKSDEVRVDAKAGLSAKVSASDDAVPEAAADEAGMPDSTDELDEIDGQGDEAAVQE